MVKCGAEGNSFKEVIFKCGVAECTQVSGFFANGLWGRYMYINIYLTIFITVTTFLLLLVITIIQGSDKKQNSLKTRGVRRTCPPPPPNLKNPTIKMEQSGTYLDIFRA